MIGKVVAETQTTTHAKTNREDVETFIKENLVQASPKSVAGRFGIRRGNDLLQPTCLKKLFGAQITPNEKLLSDFKRF